MPNFVNAQLTGIEELLLLNGVRLPARDEETAWEQLGEVARELEACAAYADALGRRGDEATKMRMARELAEKLRGLKRTIDTEGR